MSRATADHRSLTEYADYRLDGAKVYGTALGNHIKCHLSIKEPLINLSYLLASRQIASQGAVPQEGWLPFKVLQRSEAVCLKAPPGAVLTAIRCVVPLAKPNVYL